MFDPVYEFVLIGIAPGACILGIDVAMAWLKRLAQQPRSGSAALTRSSCPCW
jgi:hypothetical protein